MSRETRRIRVLLADNHPAILGGLAALLGSEPDIEVVGVAWDGIEAVTLSRKLHPCVVIMDIKMPGMNGIEATRLIRSKSPTVSVIGLTMSQDPEQVSRMLAAGAMRCLSKSANPCDLIQAIREAVA